MGEMVDIEIEVVMTIKDFREEGSSITHAELLNIVREKIEEKGLCILGEPELLKLRVKG